MFNNKFNNEITKLTNILRKPDINVEEMKQMLSDFFKIIAPEINTALIMIEIESRKNLYSKEIDKRSETFFNDEKFETDSYSITNKISDNMNITAKFFPKSRHKYTDQEKNKLELITNIVYAFYSNMRSNEMIDTAYYLDVMTGMPNTAAMIKYGNELKEKEKLDNYCLAFINIKGFKIMNKVVGPSNVEEVLRQYVKYISILLEKDEMLARLGGDNFALLLKNETVIDKLNRIKKIRFEFNNIDINLENRLGVYQIQRKDNIHNAMENASITIQAAKVNNLSYLFYNEDMANSILDTKEIIMSFPKALQNEEFEVYYQPKVDTTTNTMTGTEALVRWNRNNQLLSPYKFVPILENEKLISKLDFYILEKVCKSLKEWIDLGLEPVRISTNFSKSNLSDPNFGSTIVSILKKYEIDPKYIEVEVTETLCEKIKEKLIGFIHEMKEYDIYTSIDDFGTGDSSLNLLQQLDVNTIKIDKKFIDDWEKSKTRTIIECTIMMLEKLGINVIAEGVEKEEQAEYLRSIGCNTVQGYLYDKPLPKEEYVKRIENKKYKK